MKNYSYSKLCLFLLALLGKEKLKIKIMRVLLLFVFLFCFFSCSSKINYDYSFKQTIVCNYNNQVEKVYWISNYEGRPPLNLKVDSLFVKDLNKVLDTIKLPRVNYKADLLSNITGYKRIHNDQYVYEDYTLGKLTVYRAMGSDRLNTYWDGVWKVYLEPYPENKSDFNLIKCK